MESSSADDLALILAQQEQIARLKYEVAELEKIIITLAKPRRPVTRSIH